MKFLFFINTTLRVCVCTRTPGQQCERKGVCVCVCVCLAFFGSAHTKGTTLKIYVFRETGNYALLYYYPLVVTHTRARAQTHSERDDIFAVPIRVYGLRKKTNAKILCTDSIIRHIIIAFEHCVHM